MSTAYLDKIIVNLKVISKIGKNGRLSIGISDNVSIEQDNLLTGLKRRFISGDSRGRTVEFINSTVEEAIEKSNDLMESRFIEIYDGIGKPSNYEIKRFNEAYAQMRTISKELSGSIKGIENLKSTYLEDANIISKIECIISKIQNYLINISQKIDWCKTQSRKYTQKLDLLESSLDNQESQNGDDNDDY